MSRYSAPHRQAVGGFSSAAIAAMPLDQLRELSDLQLSERELADVIAAIHTGGAHVEDMTAALHGCEDETAQCVLCQQEEHLTSTHCLACKGSADVSDIASQIQLLAEWAEWYRQYKVWATSHQR